MKRLFINDTEYRKLDAVANSTLLLMQHNPSDVEWLKHAPTDVTKAAAADFGKALHAAILEPEKFDDAVYISSVAGRTTKTFSKDIEENPDKIVLTESEAQQIRIMQASGMAHPAFAACLNAESFKESSIIVHDKERGIDLKIRPDIDAVESKGFIANLKTTASLDDWRNDRGWINPIVKFNYWHDACYSLYVAGLFYGRPVDIFKWAVLQKSASLGRYPVSCFTITKQRLIDEGFYDQMLRNLDEYARRYHSNDWCQDEDLPMFGDSMEIVEVSE